MALPTPLWTLGGVSSLFIDEDSGGQPATIGELHVLDSTKSTKHHSGSTGRTRRLGGTLFDTDGNQLSTLLSYTESDTSRALTSDLGSEGNWKVKNVERERKQDLSRSYGVYRVTIELLEA